MLAEQNNRRGVSQMVLLLSDTIDSAETVLLNVTDDGAAASKCSQSEPCGTLN